MVIQTSSPELTKRIHEAIAEELRKLTPRVYCHVCEFPLRVTSNSVSGIDLTSNIIVEPCNCCKEEKPEKSEEEKLREASMIQKLPFGDKLYQTSTRYFYVLGACETVTSFRKSDGAMAYDRSKEEVPNTLGSGVPWMDCVYENFLKPAGFVWSDPEDGNWGFRMDSKNLYLYRRGTRRIKDTLHLKEGCEFLAIGQNDKYFWPCDEDGLTSTEEQWKEVRNLFSNIMAKKGLGLHIPIWW